MSEQFDSIGKPPLVEQDPIRDFLTRVVPSLADGGYVSIHWQFPGKKRFFEKSFRTVDEALAQVAKLQGKRANIYFCVSRQREGNGKRSGAGALDLNSLFVDADIDPGNPKCYPRLAETIAGLIWFCDRTGIPRPSLLVKTGGGLHVYWISHVPLPIEQWRPFANGLKRAMQAAGLKIKDIAVTGDAARVLRVPGTLNYKYDPPRQVSLLPVPQLTNESYDFSKMFTRLLEAAPACKPAPAIRISGPVAPAFRHLKLVPLGRGIEAPPPLSFEAIKTGCGWLREAHDTGGEKFDQWQWKLSVLATAFLEGGRDLAHKVSEKHPGYTSAETDAMYDRNVRERAETDLGWRSCRAISDAKSTHCKNCVHFSNDKSPLHLGLIGDDNEPSKPESTDDELAIIAKWNQEHAHVLAGGKSAILQEFKDAEGYVDFKLLSSASFREWNIEHEITRIDRKGRPDTMPATKFWMQHPERRKYQDIGFFPGRDKPGFYNLWHGFAVEPRKGDCSKFLAHLHDNACRGNTT